MAKAVLTVDDADRIPELVAQAVPWPTADARAGGAGGTGRRPVRPHRRPVRIGHADAAPPLTKPNRDALLKQLWGATARPDRRRAGLEAQSVGNAITALAKRDQIPLAAAFRWQNTVEQRVPLRGYLGLGGSRNIRALVTKMPNLIVALGPRLDDPTSDGYHWTRRPAGTVLVSQAPGDLGRPPAPAPALAIRASLESVAAALRDAGLPSGRPDDLARPAPQPSRTGSARRPRTTSRSTPPPSRAPARGAAGGRGSSPTGRQLRDLAAAVLRVPPVRHPARPQERGDGVRGPGRVAAEALHPDRTVVAFAGDGCFLMSGSELATAVQYGLAIIVIVVDNGMYGTIRMHQERTFPGHVIATELLNPDFAAYARRSAPSACWCGGPTSSRPPSRPGPRAPRAGPDRAPHRPGPAQPGPAAQLAQRSATRLMKHNPDRWRSISCAAPSASPAVRQSSSRRRELRMMPSATSPTETARLCVHPTATPAAGPAPGRRSRRRAG